MPKFVNDNTEEAARGYLGGDGNVDFPTFKDALASIAIDTNRNVNELFMAFMKWCHCYSTCIPPPEEPSTTVKKRRMRMKPKSTKDD
ncbi:unnamed protein product [Plutella xylostella]|uniref:(diamondback moth) hypothetical protein n=1 Tax=Plutella xylostella TaxID=51655 RepID=A0A8S4G4B5_PLUXY|nr:unnamed protein product [Plutella xylostella]